MLGGETPLKRVVSSDTGGEEVIQLVRRAPKAEGCEISPQEVRALAPAGARAFFRIAEAWSMTEREQMRILGIINPAILTRWRDGDHCEAITAATLERISCVLGIFKAINVLLPDPARADAWMRKANKAPLFVGKSALDLIADGSLVRLRALRTYLDAELNG